MNVLLLNYEYPPIGAGAANATYNMAKSLVQLGHRPIVVTSAFQDYKGYSEEEGISVYRLPANRKYKDHSNILQMACYILSSFWAMGKIFQKEKFSACIAFFTIPSAPLAWFLKKRFGIEYIVSLRGGDVPGTEPSLDRIHEILKSFRRILFQNAIAIVANSQGLANLSEKKDPFPVRVIPNGVDCDFFYPIVNESSGEYTIRILFVGRFQEQKNLPKLVRQFAKAKSKLPDMELTLVGNGPLKSEIFSLVENLKIQSSVHWMDWQSKPELSELYRKADIFINPSLYEGMPNTVMEAMASGLPVIASDIFGNNDLVVDGVTGRLFALSDEDALSQCILEMVGSSQMRKKMGNAGRKRVYENFSWLKVTEGYLEIFKGR